MTDIIFSKSPAGDNEVVIPNRLGLPAEISDGTVVRVSHDDFDTIPSQYLVELRKLVRKAQAADVEFTLPGDVPDRTRAYLDIWPSTPAPEQPEQPEQPEPVTGTAEVVSHPVVGGEGE